MNVVVEFLINIHPQLLSPKSEWFYFVSASQYDSSLTFQREESALYTPVGQILFYPWLLDWMERAFIKRKLYISTLHGIHVHSSSVAALRSTHLLSSMFQTCCRCSFVCCSIDLYITSHCKCISKYINYNLSKLPNCDDEKMVKRN